MWRTLPEPAAARRVATLRRSDDRQRLRLVGGLRRVARRANTRGRACRYEVLLCDRAAAVRWELLEVAAALERVAEPQPETLRTLRWLLTDGCSSPLYNRDVAEERLPTALYRVRTELRAGDPSVLSGPDVVPLPHRDSSSMRRGGSAGTP